MANSDIIENFKDKASEAFKAAKEKAGPAMDSAREKAGDAVAQARVKAGPALESAKEKAGDAVAQARVKAGPVLESAKEKAGEAISAVKDRASGAQSHGADVHGTTAAASGAVGTDHDAEVLQPTDAEVQAAHATFGEAPTTGDVLQDAAEASPAGVEVPVTDVEHGPQH